VTFLLYALLAIIVIGVLFVLAALLLPKGEQISPPSPDVKPWTALPNRRIEPEDVVAVRLPVALRGYRFAETDRLLDRLTDELRRRDEEIAELRARLAPSPAANKGRGDTAPHA
jgi:DivIVA domain-containing protein